MRLCKSWMCVSVCGRDNVHMCVSAYVIHNFFSHAHTHKQITLYFPHTPHPFPDAEVVTCIYMYNIFLYGRVQSICAICIPILIH